MGLGREVADAYINIHGDLSKFRKDLERGRAVVSEQGKLMADDFSTAMAKQDTKNMKDRWGAVTKAFYSGEKLDWERVLGQFDGATIGKQRKQITAFLDDMQAKGYMTEEQFNDTNAAMKRALRTIGLHRQAQRGITDDVERAKYEQDRYNKSLRGMIDAADVDTFEAQWKKLGRTLAGINLDGVINDVDWSKMQKGTSSLEDFDGAMNDVIIRARLLGRITDEESEKVLKSLDQYVDAEKDRAKAIDETTASAKRLRSESERMKISLSGMIKAAKTKELERDFARIATAMATTNWGPVAKDFKSMTEFQRRQVEVIDRMKQLGRVSGEEYGKVRSTLSEITENQVKFGVNLDRSSRKFRPLQYAADKLSKSWRRMDSTVRVVLSLIAAGASDLATLGSGLAGSATAIISSFGMAAGAIVPLVAGFGAIGVGIALAVSGMDDLKAKFPGVQIAAENIGKTWQEQARRFAMEWGASLDSLLTVFNDKLGAYDFGTPFGKAMSGVTTAFEGVVNSPGFAALMEAMTTSLPAAMEGFGKGFANMTGMFSSLMAGAAPVAQMLGDDFARWSKGLWDSVEAGRASGELTDTFKRMRESLLVVLDLVGSVGNMLGTLFDLGSTSGNSLLRSLTGIVDQFNAWMQTEGGRDTMLTWFSNAEQIVRSMEPLMAGLGKAMGILVTPRTIELFGKLMSSMGELLPIIAEVLAVISELGIFNLVTTALVAIGKALQPLMPHLADLARLIGDVLLTSIEELTPILVEAGELFAPLLGAVVDLAQFLVPLLIPAIRLFGGAMTVLLDVVGNVVKAVVDFLSSGERIGAFFTGLGESITTMNETVNQALADFWGGIGEQLAIWGAEFKLGWDTFWNGLGETLALIGPTLQALLATAWTQITEGFHTTFVVPFQTFWDTFWNGLDPEVQQAFIVIGASITAAWNSIIGGASKFTSDFINGWNGMWGDIGAANHKKWQETIDGFNNWANGINNTVRTFINDVLGKWNKFWGDVGSRVERGWQLVTASFNTAVAVIRGVISGFVAATQARWDGFWNTVRIAAQTAMAALGNIIRTRLTEAGDYFRRLPATVGAALAGMTNLLFRVGTDMIQGLINGVREMAGQVASAARGVVQGAIDGAKALLGIRSPSRVFRSFGNYTGEGLALGLEDMKKTVTKAATDMAGMAIEAFDKSKMWIAGRDAASGLAEGLTSNKSKIGSALGTLGNSLQVNAGGIGTISQRHAAPGTVPPVAGPTKMFAEGAVQVSVSTQATDAGLVSTSVMDGLDEAFGITSKL